MGKGRERRKITECEKKASSTRREAKKERENNEGEDGRTTGWVRGSGYDQDLLDGINERVKGKIQRRPRGQTRRGVKDEGRREELRSGLEASILGEEHVDEKRLKPGFLRGSETDVEAVLLGVPEAKRASERPKDQLLLSFLVSSSVSSRRVEDLKIENGEEEEELTFSERSC